MTKEASRIKTYAHTHTYIQDRFVKERDTKEKDLARARTHLDVKEKRRPLLEYDREPASAKINPFYSEPSAEQNISGWRSMLPFED